MASGRLPFPWRPADLAGLDPRLSAGAAEIAAALPPAAAARDLAVGLRALGASFLVRGQSDFPEALAAIPDPPPFLFTRGTPLGDPASPRVGVVGSRASSQAGREIAFSLARDLALAGCVVVSGMARGIDGAAHAGALEAGGRSIAVLGTGLDVCYPPEHDGLYRSLLARGGAVTEFPPGVPGLALHFPRRNRLLSGLCDVLIVVEGGEKSGARSTVDFALQQGRELMAVPRDILHPGADLPNRLLRDGAAPVLSAADILAQLAPILELRRRAGAAGPTIPRPPAAVSSRSSGPAGLETRLLGLLDLRPVTIDACITLLRPAPPGEIQAALFRLEVLGLAERLPGGRVRLRR